MRRVLQRHAQLEELQLRVDYVPCPYFLDWRDGKIGLDKYADEVSNAICACFNKRLEECLSGHFSEEVLRERLKTCQERVYAIATQDPAGTDTSGMTCFCCFRKREA